VEACYVDLLKKLFLHIHSQFWNH